MNVLKRSFTADRAEDGWITLSTETPVPQDGLLLKAKNWDLSRADKVPIKGFFNHDTYGTPVVKWPELRVRGKKLQGKPVFASDEDPGFAGKIERLWNAGFLDDVSVSFRADLEKAKEVEHDGRTYTVPRSQTLVECSIVGIGADQNAGKGRAFSETLTRAVAEKVITEDERGEILDTLEIEIDDGADDPPPPEPEKGERTAIDENVKGLIEKFIEEGPKRTQMMRELMDLAVLGKDEAEKIKHERLLTEVTNLRAALDTLTDKVDRLATKDEGGDEPDPPEEIVIEGDEPPGERALTMEEATQAIARVIAEHNSRQASDVATIVKNTVDHMTGRLPD